MTDAGCAFTWLRALDLHTITSLCTLEIKFKVDQLLSIGI